MRKIRSWFGNYFEFKIGSRHAPGRFAKNKTGARGSFHPPPRKTKFRPPLRSGREPFFGWGGGIRSWLGNYFEFKIGSRHAPGRFAKFKTGAREGSHPPPRATQNLPTSVGRTWLAGAEGFEPPNVGTRIRCLTTWRRPSELRVSSCEFSKTAQMILIRSRLKAK